MRKYTLTLIILFLVSLPVSGTALTLDATTVPDSQGQNGLYALAYSPSNGTYHQLDYRWLRTWHDSVNYLTRPQVQVGDQFLWGGAYATYIRLDPSAIVQCATVHPREDAVLAWDVQANGTYRLQGEFFLPGNYGTTSDGINYYIKKNDTVLFNGYLKIWDIGSFDLTVGLVDTDWLYFGVNAYGNDYCDWGHLKGSINPVNPVPEPATMLLIGSGLIGLAGVRKRFKK